MKRQPRLDSTSPSPPRRGHRRRRQRQERGQQGPPPPPPVSASGRHVEDENKKEEQQDLARRAVRRSWIELTTQSGGRSSRTGLSRARVVVTPWTGWEELDEVGRNLMLVLVDRNDDDDDDDDDDANGSGAPLLQDNSGGGPADDGTKTKATTTAATALDGCENDDRHSQSRRRQQQQCCIRDALDRVEIWRVRAGGGSGLLPHAVESTHALALCLYHDQQQQQQLQQQHWDTATSDVSSSSSLALQYGSAITRTVNGLTDALQQSRSVACSVSHLAQLLGVPNWVVDVRHQSTHNALPSMPILRSAARTLLLYLDQVYWTPLRQRRWKSIERARQLLLEQQSDQGNMQGRVNDGVDGLRMMDDDEDRPEYDDDDDDGDESDDDDYRSSSDASLDKGGDHEDDDEGVNVASRCAVSLPHKVLGTTFNRFAALLDDSTSSRKAKKKEAAAQAGTAESSSVTQGSASASAGQAGDSSSSPLSPNSVPAATRPPPPVVLTWNHVPMDVAYHVVADHVVQCCRRQREAADVISTTTTTTVVPNELSTAVHMAAHRPGLLEFVTNELELWDDGNKASALCDDKVGINDDAVHAEPFPGRAWAESVRRWVALQQQQQHGTVAAAAAAAAALRSNRKRPRHHEAVSKTAAVATSSSHLVRDRAASILRRHGAGTASKMGAVSVANPTESTSHVVSLEDMEAFLNQPGTAKTNSDSAASAPRNISVVNNTGADLTGADSSAGAGESGGWSLCEAWEPCAIGALGRN